MGEYIKQKKGRKEQRGRGGKKERKEEKGVEETGGK